MTAAPYRILIIDDDPAHAESIRAILEREGYALDVATSGKAGREKLAQAPYDVILTDLVMQDVDGFEILNFARHHIEDVQVVMITGHGSIETAVQAMQQGAYTYLPKPLNVEEVRQVVRRACERVTLARDNRNMHSQLDERYGFEGLLGNAPRMRKLFALLRQVAPTDATALILGESGTGKEMVAKILHTNSLRKTKPFVTLNCAALSEGVLESELFGHVRGAFTGAVSSRVGKFEYANHGTLFLDEVGDIPSGVQVKLLRAIESGEISPVGGNETRRVDVRIVAATNRNLEELVREGRFREDLYFRLKVVQLQLPPLRERKQDFPLLLDAFLHEFSGKYGKPLLGFSQPARQTLYQYDWPGNVRELRNAVESMVVVSTGNLITKEDLPEPLASQPATGGGLEWHPGLTFAEMEKRLLQETLKHTQGNRHEAARVLAIGERTLYRKIREYHLED